MTNLQLEAEKDAARIAAVTIGDVIRRQVVGTLGTPDDLLKVMVLPVGIENFRVNVVVGKGFSSCRIANSFFLSADADGNILSSSPKMAKLY